VPIGGRLSKYREEWNKIGTDNWVLKTLKGRVSHTLLLSSPSHDHASDPHTIYAGSSEEMEEKAAIEIVSSPDSGFYSRIFLVPKSENKWRPIIDVRECAIPFLMFTLHTHDLRSSF
jgi:hypothetical protein